MLVHRCCRHKLPITPQWSLFLGHLRHHDKSKEPRSATNFRIRFTLPGLTLVKFLKSIWFCNKLLPKDKIIDSKKLPFSQIFTDGRSRGRWEQEKALCYFSRCPFRQSMASASCFCNFYPKQWYFDCLWCALNAWASEGFFPGGQQWWNLILPTRNKENYLVCWKLNRKIQNFKMQVGAKASPPSDAHAWMVRNTRVC